MTPVDFSLYLISDRGQTGGRLLVEVVASALAGGVRAVQLREKDLPARQMFELAMQLRQLTREAGARLLINDRVDVALAVDAEGVHLGTNGMPVREARRLLGHNRLIGYSAHGLNEALQAQADGADFITFGPVYHTPSKAPYGEPVGVAAMQTACRALAIPLFALGGVKEAAVPELMAAGARGVALISAIIAAPDPRQAAASILQTIEEHAHFPR